MWWKISLVSQDVRHSVGETHNICFLTLSQIALFPLHLSFGNNFMGFGLDTVCGDGDTSWKYFYYSVAEIKQSNTVSFIQTEMNT